jgi:transposase
MIEMTLPLVPEQWATLPAPDPASRLEQLATLRRENAVLCAENTVLRAENAVLRERVQELEARLGQTSANSSRPPWSDPSQASAKRRPPSSGRRRGGQPGHQGACRGLLPVEQVDEVVAVVPERCQHCQQPLRETTTRRRGRAWRHQIVELLPLAARVTEYQMRVRRCPACGKRTRAELPPGVPRRPFGARLAAMIALLSGRYRLSRQEVRDLLQDLWAVRVSLGAVVRQEQVQSAALAPVVEEACFTVQQAAVVNIDETGWRQDKRWAGLWTVTTATLTVFWIERRRSGAAIEGLLGSEFTGVVGSDRWSAYSRFPAERRALGYAHLKRDFQAQVDRGGEAAPIGHWGLAAIERLFSLWRRFRAGECDRQELRWRLIPLQARMGRLLQRGQGNPDRKAAGLCRGLRKWWAALWTFARADGVEPTNNVASAPCGRRCCGTRGASGRIATPAVGLPNDY